MREQTMTALTNTRGNVNHILVDIRTSIIRGEGVGRDLYKEWAEYVSALVTNPKSHGKYTAEEIEHAEKVLTRLSKIGN